VCRDGRGRQGSWHAQLVVPSFERCLCGSLGCLIILALFEGVEQGLIYAGDRMRLGQMGVR
jgi:hypothetical protein